MRHLKQQSHLRPTLPVSVIAVAALIICGVLFQRSVVRSIMTDSADTSLKEEPDKSLFYIGSAVMSSRENAVSSTTLDEGNSNKNTTLFKDVPLAELWTPESTEYAYIEDWDTTQLKYFIRGLFWKNNSLCSLPGNASARTRTLLKVHFGCKDLFDTNGCGTGNWLVAFYAMRLAAKVSGNIDIILQCPDAEHEKSNLILPWVMGAFRTSQLESKHLKATMGEDDAALVCRRFGISPVGYLYPDIEYELRRMALSLVGVPPEDNPIHNAVTTWLRDNLSRDASYLQLGGLSSETVEPMLSGIELDDTVIHFRCGDLMKSKNGYYGFMKFKAFTKHIHPNTRSIGILTQPYHLKKQTYVRAADRMIGSIASERCQPVVTDFVTYLQERFPNARVHVHNDPATESITLAYARMIMANQTITGIGTFGILSAMTSFGTGYARKPDKLCPGNSWIVNDTRIILTEERNVLKVAAIRELWEMENGIQVIRSWFRNASLVHDVKRCKQPYYVCSLDTETLD